MSSFSEQIHRDMPDAADVNGSDGTRKGRKREDAWRNETAGI